MFKYAMNFSAILSRTEDSSTTSLFVIIYYIRSFLQFRHTAMLHCLFFWNFSSLLPSSLSLSLFFLNSSFDLRFLCEIHPTRFNHDWLLFSPRSIVDPPVPNHIYSQQTQKNPTLLNQNEKNQLFHEMRREKVEGLERERGRMKRVGKYELGRTIGQGTFAKVKFAIDTETRQSVAVKVLEKSTVLKHKMVHQIKREISIMKIVRHPSIVRLHEVLASKTKIYIILELITGGELFDKIVHQGKLPEIQARKYFQQLIDAIDYCHSKCVFHRDLKPENLLLDSRGNVKVSDFGLSALPQQGVGLLHTTCGTPNYVAPEVLSNEGYDGSAADVWSCGVILFVLMAGFLPFDETDLATLYNKINTAQFSFPSWFSPGAKSLIKRILDPNPKTRIRIEGIRKDAWFSKNYEPVRCEKDEEVSLDDIHAVFNDIEDQYVTEQSTSGEKNGPLLMNAFEMITLSQGLDLSALFDRQQEYVQRQTRFVSRKPAQEIIATIEAIAESMGLKVHTQNYKMRLEGVATNKLGQFAVVLEVYEVAPSLFMTDVRKVAGDTLEYHKFYKRLCSKLENIIWKPTSDVEES
ncbi:hypothetical protein LUZ60_004931 [Juncus effusus]|nr:hypothetical protein LUZ60_004931 [Juncus effusus]